MMLPTSRLLQQVCRITLFTRSGCALCDSAKGVLSQVWNKRPFEYSEIDVMESGHEKWKDVYEFDTPVIHVEKSPGMDVADTSLAARKLMHRFKPADVERLMDEAVKGSSG